MRDIPLPFPMPPAVIRVVTSVPSGHPSVLAEGEASSYPAEEAERRKAKPRKFEVEQCDDDAGHDLSSLLESIECVSWSPQLLGFACEESNFLEELESDIRAFVVGRYRWMHGSTMTAPMSRLKTRGCFNMEQFRPHCPWKTITP